MAITFVQSVQTPVNTTNVTITPTAGNLLLVCFGADESNTQFTSVSDNQSGVYHAAIAFTNVAGPGLEGGIYYCYATVSSATIVTINYSSGQSDPCMIVAEYSGCASSNPIDTSSGGKTQTASGTTGTALATSNLTSSVNNEMLVGFCCFENQNLSAFGTGFNHRSSLATNIFQALEDLAVPSSGTSQPITFTAATNGDWLIMGLLLLPPATSSNTNMGQNPTNAIFFGIT